MNGSVFYVDKICFIKIKNLLYIEWYKLENIDNLIYNEQAEFIKENYKNILLKRVVLY